MNKGWGEKGARFHEYFGEFWSAGINGDTSSTQREKFISNIPKHVIQALGRKNIDEMLHHYQVSILHQKTFHDAKISMPQKLPNSEVETIKRIEQLVRQYKQKLPLEYYLTSPLKVFKTLAFHSNLSLYIYQKTLRGNLLMEGFRLLAYGFHALIFTLLIFSVFSKTTIEYKSLFSITVVLYVGYLIFIQRGIEERYTLPIFAIALISSTQVLQQIVGKVKKGKLKKPAL